MKKFCIAVFLFFSVFTEGFSQTNLNEYSYVIVPEQFEFLNQKDKYQLNSIMEFLFNKHGFHAFFNSEAPNSKRCDGLYADLERGRAILRTKLTILLKNCDGEVVYRSPDGVSKFKEFKKAYQDALRRAFKGIEALNVQQKEITYFDAVVGSETKEKTVPATTTVATQVVKPDNMTTKVSVTSKLPDAKFSSYTFEGNSYLLRKTTEGYSLYQETTSTADGLLLVGKVDVVNADKLFFTDTSERVFKASFDTEQNLSLQKGDEVMVYKRVR
ncbi:MAG: hypothetical protein K8F54_08000 [Altibacter sp.]|uniref:hypothetical protein n=1 Tax=Altibacter sp. TaxID=2024823 RepID=UPI001DE03795|nr:hypothetical protein [Altibacter sp.]MBZ0327528.1 hypothetical protein [Altibacter sp.]